MTTRKYESLWRTITLLVRLDMMAVIALAAALSAWLALH